MFKDMCSNIKLIVSEVDGIITEGLSPVDNMNNTLFKFYYMRDFEAVNLLKKDYIFVFLSSDNNVSYNIMRTRNIPFFWARGDRKETDKKHTLMDIMHRYSVSPEEVMYIGCSYSDIECMNMIPLSLCTNDSAPPVLKLVGAREELYGRSGVINQFGGGGIIGEVYDILAPIAIKRLDKQQ